MRMYKIYSYIIFIKDNTVIRFDKYKCEYLCENGFSIIRVL